MKLHKDSHVDHGLTAPQLAHILLTFEGRDAAFKETIVLPAKLGTVPCGLFGPVMGDDPIPSMLVEMRPRGNRAYPSRMIKPNGPPGTDWFQLGNRLLTMSQRRVNTLTVIAGPHDGHACVLYTSYGGPIAPREPDDPTLPASERPESIAFWSEHGLGF